jgi:hypothetical protein
VSRRLRSMRQAFHFTRFDAFLQSGKFVDWADWYTS